MRTVIILLAAASGCFAEAPYPPSGTKPQGTLLVLPNEYGAPREKATPTENTRGDNYENVRVLNSNIMEKIRQKQGSERGVYHVYLQDGRLQRVQYTTAPVNFRLQAQQKSSTTQYRQQQEQGSSDYVASVQYSQVEPITGPVYSYSPQALTRILRYAPVYY